MRMDLAYDLYLPPGDSEKNLPPVILLHGMTDSKKTWKNIAPAISRETGRKVYALDARNHGDSPRSDLMTFDILADDLDCFLSRHGIPVATLVGHSMGGRTAATLALRKPEKVEKCVVEDMHLRQFRPSSSSFIMHLIRLLQSSIEQLPPGIGLEAAREAVASYFAEMYAHMNPKVNKEKLEASLNKFDRSVIPLTTEDGAVKWKTNLDALATFLTTNNIVQTVSGTYMGDALFLCGEKSFFKVFSDPLICKHFPRSEKIVYEKAGHVIHWEIEKTFTNDVCAFVNERWPTSSKY